MRIWTERVIENAPWRPFLVLSTLAGASLAAGCSSSSTQAASVQILDPTQAHYGNTDDVWATLWWKWIYELPQTESDAGMPNCVVPVQDPTGANCAVGQSGDVFFLVGDTGGTVVRNQCVVPSGKAIFFPILSFDTDNGGVPVSMQLSDTAMMGVTQNQLDNVTGLSAEFDGVPITNLGRFKTQVTKFSYTLPPEPNTYTCEGATGVTGVIDPSYAAGYYIMLAPPPAGTHVLHFAGSSPKSQPPFMLDVTYNFTVK
jgi:hypothetical protein